MNQTYVVKPNDLDEARRQFKIRINDLKKRTKLLLHNHNWQKFFISESTSANNSISSGNDLAGCQSSMSPDKCRRGQASMTPLSSCSSSYDQNRQTVNYDISKIKIMTFDDDRQYNMTVKRRASRKDSRSDKISLSTLFRSSSSMTFIGDVVCTSTPTRRTSIDKIKPLSSTPNTSTHNPYEHHPSRTIRRKRQRIDECHTPVPAVMPVYPRQHSCNHHQQQQHCPHHHHHHHHQHRRSHHHHHHHNHHQHHHHHNHHRHNQIARLPTCNLLKETTKQQSQQKIKFKSSDFEISLQNLLYTPNKPNTVDHLSPNIFKKRRIYFL